MINDANKQRFNAAKASQTWETPRFVLDQIEDILGAPFVFDICATPETSKCQEYFTPADDALVQDWNDIDTKGGYLWMNPPFGMTGTIDPWVYSAAMCRKPLVALYPVNPSTTWWHDGVLSACPDFIWVRGRIAFLMDGEARRNNNKASILCVYNPINPVPKNATIIGARKRYIKRLHARMEGLGNGQ